LALRQEFFRLNSSQDTLASTWTRDKANVSLNSKIFVPGYHFSLDQNALTKGERDSVMSKAMNFKEHLVFLKSNDSLPYSFLADAAWRQDNAPFFGRLLNDPKAFTSNITFPKQWTQHSLGTTFTYREVTYLQRNLPSELTIMGKLDYQGSLLGNTISSDLSYAIGTGCELHRKFIFFSAPNRDGTHTWRDDDGDGIQQLNEFYLAINPEEKQYIKVFVPTDTFLQAYTSIFNYRLQSKFPESWKQEGGLKAFLFKFSNTTSLSVEEKVPSTNFKDRINPFVRRTDRADILPLRQVFRSSFFFNRASAEYGFDLSLFDSQFKQLLSEGIEDLIQRDWKLNT
jgi:hypothetical protein